MNMMPENWPELECFQGQRSQFLEFGSVAVGARYPRINA